MGWVGAGRPRVVDGGVAGVVAAGASWRGRAVNLSTGGAFITGGPELEVGRRLSVTIDLCDHKPPIEAHAKVVWIRPSAGGAEHAGVGVRLVRIGDGAGPRRGPPLPLHQGAPRRSGPQTAPRPPPGV